MGGCVSHPHTRRKSQYVLQRTSGWQDEKEKPVDECPRLAAAIYAAERARQQRQDLAAAQKPGTLPAAKDGSGTERSEADKGAEAGAKKADDAGQQAPPVALTAVPPDGAHMSQKSFSIISSEDSWWELASVHTERNGSAHPSESHESRLTPAALERLENTEGTAGLGLTPLARWQGAMSGPYSGRIMVHMSTVPEVPSHLSTGNSAGSHTARSNDIPQNPGSAADPATRVITFDEASQPSAPQDTASGAASEPHPSHAALSELLGTSLLLNPESHKAIDNSQGTSSPAADIPAAAAVSHNGPAASPGSPCAQPEHTTEAAPAYGQVDADEATGKADPFAPLRLLMRSGSIGSEALAGPLFNRRVQPQDVSGSRGAPPEIITAGSRTGQSGLKGILTSVGAVRTSEVHEILPPSSPSSQDDIELTPRGLSAASARHQARWMELEQQPQPGGGVLDSHMSEILDTASCTDSPPLTPVSLWPGAFDRRIEFGKDAYEEVRDLGQLDCGMSKLLRGKLTGKLYASKWIRYSAGTMLSRTTEREIVNHRRLLHPNIIAFKEVFTDHEDLVIVMEYAGGGSLQELLAAVGFLPEDKARVLFRQLVESLCYCHKQGVCHRNLCLENLLLAEPSTPGADPVLKVSDWGYSRDLAIDSIAKSQVAVPAYNPPELLLPPQHPDMQNGSHKYSLKAVDVWSAGVILYHLICGCQPFQDAGRPKLLTQRMVRNITNSVFSYSRGRQPSRACMDLLSSIFVRDPAKRITAEQMQSHPWLSDQPMQSADSSPFGLATQTDADIHSVLKRARKRKARQMRLQKPALQELLEAKQ